MALRQSITLPDCRLMAAVCPELVTVRQHYRWGNWRRGSRAWGCGQGGRQGVGQQWASWCRLADFTEQRVPHCRAQRPRTCCALRRIEPRAYGDSWRQQVSSPQKVRAAVAAAAAAEAAAAGSDEPLPNPMHLRTDGAGTVLEAAALVTSTARGAEGSAAGGSRAAGGGSAGDNVATAAAAAAQVAAEEDTHVVEVVDPGK